MATITEDYVSFKTAKLLKEKGFDEPTLAYAYDDNMISYYSRPRVTDALNVEAGRIPLPTLQMAMKWLRKVHNIDIIAPPQYDNFKWTYSAIIFKLLIPCIEIRFNDNKNKKEEAVEAAIKYCLENLIK